MPKLHLDLKALREYDEDALDLLFRNIANSWHRRLKGEEVNYMYENGITIIPIGDGFHSRSELNYAFFYYKISKSLPLKLTIKCHTSTGSPHRDVIRYGGIDNLIVSGNLVNGRFSSFSSTWVKTLSQQTYRYSLGVFINEMILNLYKVKKI